MAREDRFYAFIIAHTSRSRARVQRIRVEKRSVTIFCAILLLFAVGLFYGLYGLTQQAAHLRTEFENQRLRAENERQRQELEKLNNRVEKVEDTSRKLAEKSGVVDEQYRLPGTGGPALPLDEMGLATLDGEDEPARRRSCALTRRFCANAATLRPFGRSRERSKADLADAGIRLAAAVMSFIPGRTSKRRGARRWLPAPADECRLLAGKMVMDSSSSSITAAV